MFLFAYIGLLTGHQALDKQADSKDFEVSIEALYFSHIFIFGDRFYRWDTPWNCFFSYVHPSVTDHKKALLRDGSGPSNR